MIDHNLKLLSKDNLKKHQKSDFLQIENDVYCVQKWHQLESPSKPLEEMNTEHEILNISYLLKMHKPIKKNCIIQISSDLKNF